MSFTTYLFELDPDPNFLSSWIRIRIRIQKNCWIRIRKQLMRIHSSGFDRTEKLLSRFYN